MSAFRNRVRKWSNQELARESKHILNQDPSSYNWTPTARQDILDELNARKTSGKIGMKTGVTNKYKARIESESKPKPFSLRWMLGS